MSDNDEVEDAGHEQIEKAFLDSENHEWCGEKLEPYSMARRVAAQAIDLRYGSLDDAQIAKFNETRIYPGALRDVAVLLWLCSLKDEDEIDRAARNPLAAARTALKWAESKGMLDEATIQFVEGYKLLFKIMSEIDAARVAVQKKTPTEAPTASEKLKV